ncbi:MAG: OmpA family protein [Thiobacillus sp.]|nr:OmpA family protein [Thiobacillus sp.]
MNRTALAFSVVMVLAGCASQEPVKIVDAACESATCQGQLALERQNLATAQGDCNRARQELQECIRGRDAAMGQVQAEKEGRSRAEKALAERAGELVRCQGDLSTLRQQAQADAASCAEMREDLQKYAKAAETRDKQGQRMRELEKGLRQRLQSEIGNRDVEIDQLRSQLTVRVLDRILFESGSADILPGGRRVLDAVAAALAGGDETIRIEGHADTVPIGPSLKSKYYSNWELSTGRSSSVVRYFEDQHGVAPTRMEAVGFSKYRPIASNDTEENRQRNRRVEIVLTPWKPDEAEAIPIPNPNP